MAYRNDATISATADGTENISRPQPLGSAARHTNKACSSPHHAAGDSFRLLAFSRERAKDEAIQTERIRKAVEEAIGPSNILERFGVDLVTDMMVEIAALQRIRPYLLETARYDAITHLLIGRLPNAHALVLAMQRGDQEARTHIAAALLEFGITDGMIEAQAYLLSIDLIDQLNRLSAQAQLRLDMQLRQIERRRPRLAAELQALSKELDTDQAPQSNIGGAHDL